MHVVGEVVDEVGEIDVDHGPHADETAETDPGLAGPVEDGRTQGAALAEQGQVAGPSHGGRKTGVEPADGMNDSQTVGPNHPHASLGNAADLVFQDPSFRSQFGEAGRDEDGRRNAIVDAFLDHARHRGRGGGHHRQVHWLGHCGQVGIAVYAVDGVALGIDGVNDPTEGVFQQVSHQDAADRAWCDTGTDDGNRTGFEDGVQRMT